MLPLLLVRSRWWVYGSLNSDFRWLQIPSEQCRSTASYIGGPSINQPSPSNRNCSFLAQLSCKIKECFLTTFILSYFIRRWGDEWCMFCPNCFSLLDHYFYVFAELAWWSRKWKQPLQDRSLEGTVGASVLSTATP